MPSSIATALFMLPLIAQTGPVMPESPLSRVDPRVNEVRMEFVLTSETEALVHIEHRGERPRIIAGRRDGHLYDTFVQQRLFGYREARIALPFLKESVFSRAIIDTVHGQVQVGTGPVVQMGGRFELEEGQPFGTHAAVIPLGDVETRSLRFNIEFRAQTWSSQLNESVAARVPWPVEWPEEVREGLRPQTLIESDNPAFRELIERITEGRLREVTPFIAAKEIVRWCAENISSSTDGQLRGGRGALLGLDVVGAAETMRVGGGTPMDLACVAVAMLRAAGIPARIVIGMTDEDRRRDGRGSTRFIAWGEFFIPTVGWIPFDADDMQGRGLRTRPLDQAWPGFGTMRRLNRRVPVAYGFAPDGYNGPQLPALFGIRAAQSAGQPAQMMRLAFSSRGPARPDQQD